MVLDFILANFGANLLEHTGQQGRFLHHLVRHLERTAVSHLSASRYSDEGTDSRRTGELQEPMLPFIPGRRAADKERASFAVFSTIIGAVEIARMLPAPAMREKVLASARDLLFRSS
jgi:hypothetical protein